MECLIKVYTTKNIKKGAELLSTSKPLSCSRETKRERERVSVGDILYNNRTTRIAPAWT